jgi:hypothetical protein
MENGKLVELADAMQAKNVGLRESMLAMRQEAEAVDRLRD